MSSVTTPSTHDFDPELTAQAKLVLAYLNERRTLTPMIAMISLGVGSLTARIAELRKAGYDIGDEWVKDHFNRRYKTYWLGTERPKEKPDGDVASAAS
jgi:hypothetical protein